MSGVRGPRRALASAAAVLAVGLGAAGCATSSNAMTANNYTSADGVKADSGLIGARNLLLVSGGSGATLSGAFANSGTTTDSVVSIAVGTTRATVVPGTGLAIPVDATMTFGLGGGGPEAFLTGPFTAGLNVTMTVTFEHAAAMVLRVPVLPRTGFYTSVPVPAGATVSSTPAASSPSAG